VNPNLIGIGKYQTGGCGCGALEPGKMTVGTVALIAGTLAVFAYLVLRRN
jgi:hypothetical protein